MQNYRAALYDKQPSHMCPTEFTTYSDAKIVESVLYASTKLPTKIDLWCVDSGTGYSFQLQ